MKKKKRLQIDLSEEAFGRLELLRQSSNSQTNTEVCRKSIRLLDTLISYQQKGYSLNLKSTSGEDFPFPLGLL